MKRLCTALVLTGIAAYVVAFYATPLPSLQHGAGRPPWRIEMLLLLLLRPDDWLFSHWFGVPPQLALADRLPVLLVAGMILAWAAATGWLLLAPLRIRATRLETFVFAMAVGLNALSTWTLLLGLFGLLNRTWTFVVPAIVTFAAAACLWRWRQRKGVHYDNDNAVNDDTFGLRWLWLALPFVLAILLAAVLPPLDFDVREYHSQAPKEFFQQGRITFLPHNVYANMAMGTEMFSLLAMVIVGDWWWGALAGKTVIAAFTPLCALGLLAAGRQFFSTGAGVVAALVYISIPWVVSISSLGLVEGVSACYLFLAVYALLLAGRQGTPYLALAGYLAGGAVATKYPAVLFVLLPLAVWVFVRGFGAGGSGFGTRERVLTPAPSPQPRIPSPESRTPSPIFSRLVALTIFLLAASAGCGLWFGKNWVLTGNPTYPLLYEVFDGKTWNADKQRQWNRVHRPHDFSAKTLGKDLGRVVLTSEWLSPLLVPLAALAFVGGLGAMGRPRLVWGLLAYAGFIIAVWWLFTHRIDRFWIPVLPVLALLAGAGACWSSARWWQKVLKGLLLAGLGANFLVISAGQGNDWFVPLEQLRNDPQRMISPWHWYFNLDLAEGGVLLVGDAAVFDLKPPVLYNTCFDDCIFERLVKGKPSAEIRAELAARQIAYVFVNWDEIGRYRDTYGYTEFVQPEVFDRLVDEGVLEPLPPLAGYKQQAYRVK